MPGNCINILNLYHDSKLDFHLFYGKIMDKMQQIIVNTINNIYNLRHKQIFSENDFNVSMKILNDLYEKGSLLINKIDKKEYGIEMECQTIADKLFVIVCSFGTQNINDIFFLCNFIPVYENDIIKGKYNIIESYLTVIGVKKAVSKTKKTTSFIICDKINNEKYIDNNVECFDIDISEDKFFQKLHGIIITFINKTTKITIRGIIENVEYKFINNPFIKERIKNLNLTFTNNNFNLNMVKYASLKEILVFSDDDFKKRFMGNESEINSIKKNKMDIIINKFSELSLYNQRNMLFNLLLHNEDEYILFITNILYEIILLNSNDNNRIGEQIQNSFTYNIKLLLKECASFSVNYSQSMIKKYDTQNITLEQQIYLLKVEDNVKEKALIKFKEVRSKSDDSNSKAKQYLEGLVKIPFGIYKRERVLTIIENINQTFLKLIKRIKQIYNIDIVYKQKYTLYEMKFNLNKIYSSLHDYLFTGIEELLSQCKLKQISAITQLLQNNHNVKIQILNSKKNKIIQILSVIKNKLDIICIVYDEINKKSDMIGEYRICKSIENEYSCLNTGIEQMKEALNECIHSHQNAKTQVFKIIAQWINGKQGGYCFGFEGSPGIGKTSLAKKGISMCLKDENGENRPFSFIALGGSSNGSSLEGHSYTYMNSTWGRIVDILMESKCMNPIIYIDELDKVSNTEHGKEIIGILTHIIDSTQNSCFQDKYFSGIDIDLSKVLFIFSYNSPELIDRILLDRIHRVKFDNLSNEDKIIITKKYLIPEINEKMGFENIVTFDNDVLEYIIENYTCEPGVRKLKEILFDIFGEINIELLTSNNNIELPYIVKKDDLESKFLKKYHRNFNKLIHKTQEIGTINGLWANTMGKGGIIPIQTLFFPSSSFLELKLTGLQGDVMKESMNVAKTLAWNLTNKTIKTKLLKYFNDTKCQGLHIHCPEGSISKDGPSAGAAITTAIYSLFNNILLPNDVAITGEITLKGDVNAIGGLYEKINGGIKAGIKTFIIPKQNERDYKDVVEKYQNKNISIESIIVLHKVENINQIFKILVSL